MVVSAALAAGPVDVFAVPPSTTVVPGEEFELALLLHVAPTWRVAWQRDHDGQAATTLALTLPEGFELVSVNWPVPTGFERVEERAELGYAGRVAVFAVVRAPEDLSSEVELGLHASWEACAMECLPGEADLLVQLPVGDGIEAANQVLLAPYRALLPPPLADLPGAEARVEMGRSKATLYLELPGVKDGRFVPGPEVAGELGVGMRTSTNEGTSIRGALEGLDGRAARVRELTGLVTGQIDDRRRTWSVRLVDGLLVPPAPPLQVEPATEEPEQERSGTRESASRRSSGGASASGGILGILVRAEQDALAGAADRALSSEVHAH